MYTNGVGEEAGHKAPPWHYLENLQMGRADSVVFRELLAFSELLPALPSHLEGRWGRARAQRPAPQHFPAQYSGNKRQLTCSGTTEKTHTRPKPKTRVVLDSGLILQ